MAEKGEGSDPIEIEGGAPPSPPRMLMTGGARARARARAPERTDLASEMISSRGGTIQLPKHGISLCIPDSALQKDCKITLKVLQRPSSVFSAEDEAIVSPGIVCEPSGTTFEKPLKLVIPHCALLTDPSKVKVNMYFTHGDEEVTKKELPSTGTPSCVVGKDDLEVYIDHFSIFEVFMVISEYFIGKRIASTPYLPRDIYCLQRHYCHLRLYNDTPGLLDLIETEEKSLGFGKMAPTQTMFVFWQKGELNIRCEVDDGKGQVTENEKKTVSTSDIYRLERNVMNFVVIATDTFAVDLKFFFHPHCDEGHVFSMLVSGSTPFKDPQGAAAAVGEVSTSKPRKVSDEMLNNLAKHVPANAYNKFSEKLGIEQNQARNIVVKYQNDYEKATRECTANWMDVSTRSVADLHEVLRAAELGGLIFYCN